MMNQDSILHDSHQPIFRKPFGAVPTGEKLTLSLWIGRQILAKEVFLHLFREGEEECRLPLFRVPIDTTLADELRSLGEGLDPNKGELFRVEVRMPEEPGLFWYYFLIHAEGGTLYYGNNDHRLGGVGTASDNNPIPYQITLFRRGFTTPSWFKEGIVYQIFVDRFLNGNEDGRILNPKKNALLHAHWDDDPLYIRDEKGRVIRWNFFGGNLLGVLKKLPYLKDLGITAIYFNPIFESASNHKYDTGDYHRIDPMYGDEELFRRLCEEAKKMGIRIILDGVFSHTGSNSKYFNKDGAYPTVGAYQSPDSPYYPWYRFIRYPDEYESWWGIETMPNVNETEPSFMEYVIDGEDSVLKHWSRAGISGWRFDVADELPDLFIERFREVQKAENPESILIGEVWEDASNKISYGKRRRYLLGDQFDSVMNYPLREIMIQFILGKKSGVEVYRQLMSLYENYPREVFFSLLNMIGTHDTPRILTVMKAESEDLALTRLKLLILWQMTFPGVPHLFYGDEAGLEGGRDPLNRRTYPWGNENQEILTWYKRMIRMRKSLPPFYQAEWQPFAFGDDGFGYRLIWKEEGKTLLVLLNRNTKESLPLTFAHSQTVPFLPYKVKNLLTGTLMEKNEASFNYILHPLEGAPLLIDESDQRIN